MSIIHEIDGILYYEDESGNLVKYPVFDHVPAYPASEDDIEKDEIGFTDPNLHRREDPSFPVEADDSQGNEIAPRKYTLQIHDLDSYRTTEKITHIDYTDLESYSDSPYYEEILQLFEESERNEIP